MKWWLIIGLFIITGCTDQPETKVSASTSTTLRSPNNDTLATNALRQLYNLININNHNARIHSETNEIQLGDTTIELKVKVEFNGKKQQQHLFAAGFTTQLKSSQPITITTGIVGSGTTSLEAQKKCIDEWVATFADPFAQMITRQKTLTAANLKIYNGPLNIKGTVDNINGFTGDAKMIRKIILPLLPLITSNNNQIIPVEIKLLIQNSLVLDGECRIGNFVSLEVLKILKKIKWPASREKILFTQFYIINKSPVIK